MSRRNPLPQNFYSKSKAFLAQSDIDLSEPGFYAIQKSGVVAFKISFESKYRTHFGFKGPYSPSVAMQVYKGDLRAPVNDTPYILGPNEFVRYLKRMAQPTKRIKRRASSKEIPGFYTDGESPRGFIVTMTDGTTAAIHWTAVAEVTYPGGIAVTNSEGGTDFYSPDAEIVMWDKDGNFIDPEEGGMPGVAGDTFEIGGKIYTSDDEDWGPYVGYVSPSDLTWFLAWAEFGDEFPDYIGVQGDADWREVGAWGQYASNPIQRSIRRRRRR